MLNVSREPGKRGMMKKRPIYISVVAKDDESTDVSFYFGKATVAQLSMINHELDILKKDIINRLENAPKSYEINEYDEGEEPDEDLE